MKRLIFVIILFAWIVNISYLSCNTQLEKCDSDWTVIGAGPAGIITIGVLLDLGIAPNRITWIDPEFNVGRLSSYSTVIANTKNRSFIKFLESCKSFVSCAQASIEKLKQLELEVEYPLESIIEPLKIITDSLCQKVNAIKGYLNSLYFEDNVWKINVGDKNLSSVSVILATGSYPKTLEFNEYKNKEIPLDIALNKATLGKNVTRDDIIAVFGSSHSAILILKYLTELTVKKIINFYKTPIQYAIEIADFQLNINGLKGTTASWAKKILERNPPDNLVRLESKPELLNKILPLCTKIIYAIGFRSNKLNIKEIQELKCDDNGIIAPRLFGIGIAFPEKHVEPLGQVEYKIGLKDFMEYAQKLVPCWLSSRKVKLQTRKQIELLSSFDKLFVIQML